MEQAIASVKLLEKEAAHFLKTRIEKNPNLSQMPQKMKAQLIEAL
ncbi:hypothetical protein LEP1GSC196_3622 [Leptospira meyeri serovar Semaranga str. Veldrot Semarang 173]|nr:hypothetical protein LEP1GSC196_3622 [Leptospira meyeri serovar Semaranga str. Veldrot Semarang 173]